MKKQRELVHLLRQLAALDTTPNSIKRQRDLLNQELDLIHQLTADAKVRIENAQDEPPLHFAIGKGYFNVASFLIENGADLQLSDRSGFLPIHVAMHSGRLEFVKLLLKNGADIDARATDLNKSTPLVDAVLFNSFNVVEYPLECGVHPNPPSPSSSPLLLTVQSGATNLVHRLIEAGSQVENLPLIETARISMPKVIPYLLEHGANPMPPFSEKPTPIHAPPRSK